MYAIIQRHKRLAAIIIAVASVSFLFWMFSVADVKQMFGLKRCVASVNGSCITLRDYRHELLRYSDLLENEKLRNVIKRQVLYSLISREALYQKARSLGIVASTKEVVESIKNDRSFFEGGKFSLDKYRNTLRRIGLTPEEYEEDLKKRLTVRKLLNFISLGVYLTDREEEFQKRIMSARFYGKVYLISPSSLKISYRPKEEELKDFYKRNRELFYTKEKKIYRIWKTEDKKEAHRIYGEVKKGKLPKGGEVLENLPNGLPESVRKELGKLKIAEPYSITKVGNTYYILFLEKEEPRRLRPFEEVKEEVKRRFLEEKRKELARIEAEKVRKLLEEGKKVDYRSLKFDGSSVSEFITLFRIPQKEMLRLIFSKERVFGPYRTAGGYAVVYIERREFKPEKVKEEEKLKENLLTAKRRDLINLFIDKVVKNSDIKVNEDFLK